MVEISTIFKMKNQAERVEFETEHLIEYYKNLKDLDAPLVEMALKEISKKSSNLRFLISSLEDVIAEMIEQKNY